MSWPKNLSIKINYPLRGQTTFRIGGRARFFCVPKGLEELTALVKAARLNKAPIFSLGAGSNLLVSDKGVEGLVIKLSSAYFKRMAQDDNEIRAGSGARIAQLIKFAQDKSLTGLEFLIGIPGTLGGALSMNAGCWGFCIGDLVKEVEVMTKGGKIKILTQKELKFAYRKSNLANYIILSCRLRLDKGAPAQINNKIRMYLAKRRNLQGLAYPNAGCIFKNPRDNSAGRLIEMCGLKGMNAGGAFISERHANFIINKGSASAKDVLGLMRLVKKEVKAKFNLSLQPEIKIWEE